MLVFGTAASLGGGENDDNHRIGLLMKPHYWNKDYSSSPPLEKVYGFINIFNIS